MNWAGIPALLACACLAGAGCSLPATANASTTAGHHDHHRAPGKKQPEVPGACHAVMSCAAHRKAKGSA